MDEIYKTIINRLADRIEEEQRQRDDVSYPGNFVETSLLEDVFRFWFESILYGLGFINIEREVVYPGQRKRKGRKEACDVRAELNNEKYWIELKVAYWDTSYTRAELIADVERLVRLPNDVLKMYLVVFISETADVPGKLQNIIDDTNEYTVDMCSCRRLIVSPARWGTPDTHLMIYLMEICRA